MNLESGYVGAAIIGATGPLWADALPVSGDILKGAIVGGVAVAAGRQLMGTLKGSVHNMRISHWERLAMYAAGGAATGALATILVGGQNFAGAYTPMLVMGATAGATAYIMPRLQNEV